ncbi:MAG: hypothetical protein RJA57_86 [Bacteroidota bacterium]|jgi:hypothetical protein
MDRTGLSGIGSLVLHLALDPWTRNGARVPADIFHAYRNFRVTILSTTSNTVTIQNRVTIFTS